ncbi:MAG TPA: T9SS type A sorting domain-containing protein [Ignavibacteria bacterium]|nr:T9SS type A sorting domain-containing protein [Ignavibacteria bacterium]
MNKKSEYQLKSFKKILKNTSLTFAMFVLLAINSFSQSITWQKVLIIPGISYFTSVVQTPDDGYIAVGRHQYIENYMYIARFNKFGDTLWTKEIDKEDATCIIKTNDNNYVVCGRLGSFVKIDVNGNILNLGTFIDEESRILKVVQSNDNNYFMCGYIFTSGFFYPYLLKYNNSGVPLWDSVYKNGITGGQFSDFVISNDNCLIITGFHYLQNGQPSYLFVKKIDLNGNQVWNKTLFTYTYLTPNSIIKSVTNSYFISCFYSSILKFNSDGIFQWRINYDTAFQTGIEAMANTNDGKIVYTAFHDSGNFTSVKIRKIDTNGIEIISKNVGFANHNHTPWGIKQTFDSGYIVVGRTDFSNENAFILKTDKNGESPIGIKKISTEIPENFRLYQNYPNPFNPVTNIKYEIPKDVNVSIKIYDILGREVFCINEYKLAGSYEVQFDGSNFASGMYFYKLESDGFTDTKKMVLLK